MVTDELADLLKEVQSPDNYADNETHIYVLYHLVERLAVVVRRESERNKMLTTDLRGYWVVYSTDEHATIRGGPFPEYDTAAKEAERIGEKYTYSEFNVRYGTEDEVKRVR